MDDYEEDELDSFPLPEVSRLYKVKYRVYGRNEKLLLEMSSCLISKDAGDILDNLRSKLLGIEINGKGNDGMRYFETVDSIDLINCEYIAPIHGMTEDAYTTIKKVYESSSLFPLIADDNDNDKDSNENDDDDDDDDDSDDDSDDEQ